MTMTTNTTERQLGWIVIAIAATLLVLPAFAMGFGMLGMGPMMGGHWSHGMWGWSDGASGWMLALTTGLQLLFLAVLVAGVYLAYTALTSRTASTNTAPPDQPADTAPAEQPAGSAPEQSVDPAIEALRTAYARGEIDDDEFERRRDRLEANQ